MSEFDSYKRACIRLLATHGIEVYPETETHRISSANVSSFGMNENDAGVARFTVWCAESLLYAFVQLERGNLIQAFRAYSQFREYVGRLRGRDPLGYCDAGSACERALTDALSASMVKAR